MSTEAMRQEAAQAARQQAGDDFARLKARLPEDGALRGAWLAAYATRFADLAEPYAIEGRLIAAGRTPRFHAGQQIEFASFDSIALGRGEWRAGEIDSYYEPHWQPVYGPGTLRLDVRVTGRRGKPIGNPIAVSEFQVRVPQDAGRGGAVVNETTAAPGECVHCKRDITLDLTLPESGQVWRDDWDDEGCPDSPDGLHATLEELTS